MPHIYLLTDVNKPLTIFISFSMEFILTNKLRVYDVASVSDATILLSAVLGRIDLSYMVMLPLFVPKVTCKLFSAVMYVDKFFFLIRIPTPPSFHFEGDQNMKRNTRSTLSNCLITTEVVIVCFSMPMISMGRQDA